LLLETINLFLLSQSSNPYSLLMLDVLEYEVELVPGLSVFDLEKESPIIEISYKLLSCQARAIKVYQVKELFSPTPWLVSKCADTGSRKYLKIFRRLVERLAVIDVVQSLRIAPALVA